MEKKEEQTAEECFETACRILGPALTMALEMGCVEGMPSMMVDIRRGLNMINEGIKKKIEG